MHKTPENDSNEQVIGYQVNGTPITPEDLDRSITESQQQIEEGKFVTIEELEEESKTWL